MTVFILLGSDDYVARQVLDVFDNYDAAVAAVAENKKARTVSEMRYKLLSRQGEPTYTIIQHTVNSK